MEVFGFDIGRDVHACETFADVGFDEFLPLFAGDGNAMMSVHDKIHLPDLVEHYGRQVDILIEGAVHALPAIRELVLPGKEGAVEFLVAIQAPRDMVDANRLDAAIDGTPDVQPLLDLVVGEQGGGMPLAREDREDLFEKCFSTCFAEICTCLGGDMIGHDVFPVVFLWVMLDFESQ